MSKEEFYKPGKLEELEDKEESVYSAELHLLRKVAKTSADLVKGMRYPEFQEASGGLQVLTNLHVNSVLEYEKWLSDGQG